MKVAFIGSHGTGKTTLCFQLAAHFKRLDRHVDLVKEVARRAPLPLNRETTLDAQRWILHTQIADEIAAATHHDVVVCDRAALDNYAYLAHRCGRQAELEPLVRSWMRSYQALFLVPIVRRPGYDGVRDTSPAFQLEIDETVRSLLVEWKIDHHELNAERPADWLDDILTNLSLPLEPPQISLFDQDEGESLSGPTSPAE